jgi:DNA-binding transcriptional MerR regulator
MSRSTKFIRQFRTEVGRLIAEIEACMRHDSDSGNRELDLQREAYEERRDQAERLSRRLASYRESQQFLLEGDAHRIQESLKLSLDYFRGS